MSDNKSFPVLNDTNWDAWKIKIRGYCMQHKLAKYLNGCAIPEDAELLADHLDKEEQVAGILYQSIGQTNHQRFVTPSNQKKPNLIWALLVGYYESHSAQNQLVVYLDFCTFPYKGNVATFIDDLNAGLSRVASVGLIIGKPEKADLKESLLCEIILNKLPADDYKHLKASLFNQRPISIEMIKTALENERTGSLSISHHTTPLAVAPVIKQESAMSATTTPPFCAPGTHSPATKHSAANCKALKKKKKPTAKAATSTEPASDDNDDSDAS